MATRATALVTLAFIAACSGEPLVREDAAPSDAAAQDATIADVDDAATASDTSSSDGTIDAKLDVLVERDVAPDAVASPDVAPPDAPAPPDVALPDAVAVDGASDTAPEAASDAGTGADAPAVTISVTPAHTRLFAGTTQLFAALGGAVTWSVQEGASGGTVSAAGMYTPPAADGRFHVVATSTVNPSVSAAAEVIVWAPKTTALASTLSSARGLFNSSLKALALEDGRVLFAGGNAGSGPLAKVDIFSSTSFTTGANLTTNRAMGGYISLADGGALIAGSGMPFSGNMIGTSERFNPTTNTWTPVGSLSAGRSTPVIIRLKDGRVLVAGGEASSGTNLASAELFDPATNQWTAAGNSMQKGRSGHHGALLPDGRVIVASGSAGSAGGPQKTSDMFDPTTNRFSNGPNLVANHVGSAAAVTAEGQFMVAAGCVPAVPACSLGSVKDVDLYDPKTNKFTATGQLNHAASAHTMVLLATGHILVAGGIDMTATPQTLTRVELYDPATAKWTVVANLPTGMYDGASALLPDGRVIIAGGRSGPITGAWSAVADAAIFSIGLPTSCKVCQFDGACTTLTNGVACDDGKPTTTGDACSAGVCKGN